MIIEQSSLAYPVLPCHDLIFLSWFIDWLHIQIRLWRHQVLLAQLTLSELFKVSSPSGSMLDCRTDTTALIRRPVPRCRRRWLIVGLHGIWKLLLAAVGDIVFRHIHTRETSAHIHNLNLSITTLGVWMDRSVRVCCRLIVFMPLVCAVIDLVPILWVTGLACGHCGQDGLHAVDLLLYLAFT